MQNFEQGTVFMQDQFYNKPVVDWAKENLQNPIKITPILSSRLGKIFVYLLIFIVPLAFILPGLYLKITGFENKDDTPTTLLLCGFVLLIPFGIIALIGFLTQAKFAKSLNVDGVRSSVGKFDWRKLYYVDHVSKHIRAGRVRRKIEDNQLELVFESGKVIIPPLIYNRDDIWNLINSIPVQVRDDGIVRETQTPIGSSPTMSFDEIVELIEETKAKHEKNK